MALEYNNFNLTDTIGPTGPTGATAALIYAQHLKTFVYKCFNHITKIRMVYQVESNDQVAALSEVATIWRYAPKQETKDTAESLLKKLRPLSDRESFREMPIPTS